MITNTSKPSTSLTNTAKVNLATLWSTITTTWASETGYWEDLVSTMTNTSITGQVLWSGKFLPWREIAPWQVSGDFMTNTSKP